VARALIDEGKVLLDAGSVTSAVSRFASVVRRFDDDGDPDVVAEVATARNWMGYALGEGSADQKLQAIGVYDEVITRHSAAPEWSLREQLATAMFNRARDLWDLGRVEEAVDGYRMFLERFDERGGGESHLVPQAKVEIGACMFDLGRVEEALAAFDRVVVQYENDPDPEIRHWVAAALEHKAYALGEGGRLDEAIAVSDDLISRFRDDASDPVQLRMLVVMCWKARWLELRQEHAQALTVFGDIVDRFAEPQPPERAPSVEWARRRLAAAEKKR